MADNKYIYIINRGQSVLCSFVVRYRYDFMAYAPKQFGPRVQFSFVVANLEHDPLGLRFDRNLPARQVGDDIFIGRGCREHFHTRFGTFHTYRPFHPATAAVASHLQYVERGEHGWCSRIESWGRLSV